VRKAIIGAVFAAIIGAVLVLPTVASAAGGFDQYGYNDTARVFNGTLQQWCAAKGISADDCLAYGNPADKVVMKWNAAWDACNDTGLAADCAGAWTDNEWNGNVAGGSGWVWHYKIVWIGPCSPDGTLLPDGGYCIWGSYEVLMDQGSSAGHIWGTRAVPNGYGAHP
jgi:hypothetical protein